ncbi:MAG: GAF domain-containing protein [Chloroflexota bacterium]
MSPARKQTIEPDWKEFLRFGETLLSQADVTSQCEAICRWVENKLAVSADLWLAKPLYPLPGVNYPKILPAENPLPLLQECFEKRKLVLQRHKISSSPEDKQFTHQIAIPLLTQDNLLGILHVWRTNHEPFRPQEIEYLERIASHAALAMQVMRQSVLKNWRLEQLSLVRNISMEVTRLRNLDQFCRLLTRTILERFDYFLVSIYTFDPLSKMLVHRASASKNESIVNQPPVLHILPGEGIIGQVAATGAEIIAQKIEGDPNYRSLPGWEIIQAEAAIPIQIGGRLLGVLDLQSDQKDAFHDVDLVVLRALADYLAFAMEGMQLINGLEKRTHQISALLDITHKLTSILDFDRLLEEVVEAIQQHFGYPYVHIFILHAGRRKLFYEAGSGARSHALEEKQVSYDLDDPHGIIPWVARTGKTLLANDVSQEPLYRPSDLPPSDTRAELAIPLAYAGEILGVLDLQSDQVNSFDFRDIPLLESLGSTIAIAIRNARLYRSEVWRRQVAESFREIAGLVSANLALPDLLERILNEVDRNLPCEASAIWLIQPGTERNQTPTLMLAAVHGAPAEKVWEVIQANPNARQYLLSALNATSPLIRQPTDPIGPLGQALGFPKDYSSLAAPLRAGDEPLGLLTLAHHMPGRYGSEASLITMTFANHAAVAIQNNRLFMASQEQAWISTILLQIAEATQGTQNVEELLDTMARLTPMLAGVKKCAFFVWDESRQIFILQSEYGLNLTSNTRPLTFDLSIPLVQRLVENREIIFIQDVSKELHLAEAGLEEESGTLVILPMISRGRLLGAFLVAHMLENNLHSTRIFDQQTLDLLQGIARQTALAMENLMLIEARQEEAYVTAVMLQVAQAVVSQNNLEDILDTIVHLMPILVGIDACVIYLWEEHLEIFRTAKVFTGSQREEMMIEGETYRIGEFPLLDAVLESEQLIACKTTKKDASIQNWKTLDCLLPAEEIEQQYDPQDQWILGVPLSVKGEFYGVLVASESNVPLSFHDRRLEILSGIAQQVSLAIQNDRLNREMIQRERLEREIQLARQIQKTFLPNRLPKIPGWEVDIHWQTAREVGGDFYDVFRIKGDRFGVVIADVSDKGMPAALYMTVTKTLIRAFSQNAESPARVLERVNRALTFEPQNTMFVTAVFVILNAKDGTLRYANAGHNLPFIYRRQNNSVEEFPKGGMALGVYSSNKLSDHILTIDADDWLIFYTDGVTESFSPSGETFGEQRLRATIEHASKKSPADFLDYVREQLSDFREGNPPSDDLTLVVLHRLPPEEIREETNGQP